MGTRRKNAAVAAVAAACTLLVIGVVRPAAGKRPAARAEARPEAAPEPAPERVAMPVEPAPDAGRAR